MNGPDRKIDINCDMGESFGRYTLGQDEELMKLISSANIACGFHAGDPTVMDATLRLAKQYGVAVGAHPGYPDLQGFGRRAMTMDPDEVEALVLYQIGALAGLARSYSQEVRHVKPHGALYNQAAKDAALAAAIARAVRRFSPQLILVGLAGSELVHVGLEAGLQVAEEGFPERGYEADGSLRSRKLPGAMIDDPQVAAAQALRLATEGIEFKHGEQAAHSRVSTLCVHGDSRNALEITRTVRAALEAEGFEIRGL
jgi:UPF0271 protein